METVVGPLGFTIPVQTLSASRTVNLTPVEVTDWRNHLPMADLGSTAKKVYHAIDDCNKVNLSPQDRFEILEILRTPTQFICQSLRRHYINLTHPITTQQLTIANLAETLQLEMADGYKLIVEQIQQESTKSHALLPTALQRIMHYFTHIILRKYQLYSKAPVNVWRELHLLYQYAEKQQLLKTSTLENDYKRILLLAASFPYQWRQSEQDAIYQASETWCSLAELQKKLPKPLEPGFLVVDLAADEPPLPMTEASHFSSETLTLDLHPVLSRLKTVLPIMEPNELQTRIAHSNEPEYAVSSSILHGLIKEWDTTIPHIQERTENKGPIKMCIGLTTTHYYVNGQRPFSSQQPGETLAFSTLPTLAVNEDTSNEDTSNGASTEIDLGKVPKPEATGLSTYPTYTCTLVNENPEGLGLIWQGESYPPLQAGEVVGLERVDDQGNRVWEIGKVSWLQHQVQNEFILNILPIAKKVNAAAIQLTKGGQATGYYLRCLLFNSTLLTPILPFKVGNNAIISQGDLQSTEDIILTALQDATGSFKLFQFKPKKGTPEAPPPPPPSPERTEPADAEQKKKPGSKETFDSIWSDL